MRYSRLAGDSLDDSERSDYGSIYSIEIRLVTASQYLEVGFNHLLVNRFRVPSAIIDEPNAIQAVVGTVVIDPKYSTLVAGPTRLLACHFNNLYKRKGRDYMWERTVHP